MNKTHRSFGFYLAAGVVLGVIGGLLLQQPAIGLAIGTLVGTTIGTLKNLFHK